MTEEKKWTPSFMRLSPSKINTYMKCPREFYYKYIAGIPEKKTIHLFRGSLVHKILERLFKYEFRSYKAWESGEPEKWMQEQFESGWEEKIAKHKWLWEIHSSEEMDAMKHETEDILQNFVKTVNKKLTEMVKWKIYRTKWQAWNAVAPKYAEKWVKSQDYAIVGVIDAVCSDFDNGVTLLDYKTSKRYGAYLPEDYYRQLIIYAFLYTLEMGEVPKFVGVNYLRFDDTFFVRITQSELDEAKDLIKMVHDSLTARQEEEKEYEQIPQNLCKWCSFNKQHNGGPCDVVIPKWKPKYGSRKKEHKSENVVVEEDVITAALVQPDEGTKNTAWDD
jgi:putative RecB family exonuclease